MAVPFWLWMFAHIILASASTASSKLICHLLSSSIIFNLQSYSSILNHLLYLSISLSCTFFSVVKCDNSRNFPFWKLAFSGCRVLGIRVLSSDQTMTLQLPEIQNDKFVGSFTGRRELVQRRNACGSQSFVGAFNETHASPLRLHFFDNPLQLTPLLPLYSPHSTPSPWPYKDATHGLIM